jgi:ElaB/YqjD/DUF883 family membrane-anchored ribosome-binding protein
MATSDPSKVSDSGPTPTVSRALNTAASGAHDALGKVGEAAHAAIDKVVEATAPAAAWLGEKELAVRNAPQQLSQSTSEYLAAHPLKSLGIAFVIGVLVGRIVL